MQPSLKIPYTEIKKNKQKKTSKTGLRWLSCRINHEVIYQMQAISNFLPTVFRLDLLIGHTEQCSLHVQGAEFKSMILRQMS